MDCICLYLVLLLMFIGIALEENAGQNQNVKAGNKPFKSVT